jgi:hypothetical protein
MRIFCVDCRDKSVERQANYILLSGTPLCADCYRGRLRNTKTAIRNVNVPIVTDSQREREVRLESNRMKSGSLRSYQEKLKEIKADILKELKKFGKAHSVPYELMQKIPGHKTPTDVKILRDKFARKMVAAGFTLSNVAAVLGLNHSTLVKRQKKAA